MYAYIHLYIYTYINTQTHVYIHIYVYTHTCLWQYVSQFVKIAIDLFTCFDQDSFDKLVGVASNILSTALTQVHPINSLNVCYTLC